MISILRSTGDCNLFAAVGEKSREVGRGLRGLGEAWENRGEALGRR